MHISAKDKYNMNQKTLTDEQNALFQKIDKMIQDNGGSMEHDHSDPDQRAFIKFMHTFTGMDEVNYPGLHKTIDNARNTKPEPPLKSVGTAAVNIANGWQTTFGIPEVGQAIDTNLAAANGYGTVVGGFQTCNLSLVVKDPTSGYFIANGANAGQAPLNTLGVGTDNNTAQPFVNGAKAYLTATYMPVGGGTPVSSTILAVAGIVADPTVTEPKHEAGNTTPYDPTAINIGLGRPQGYLTNCDYIYYETIQDHPIGRVPLVGSATFTQPIVALKPTKNFIVEIFVIRTDSGGKSQINPTDMTNVYNAFQINTTVDPTGKTLTWNLPMEANSIPPSSPPYNPVVFNNIPWSSNMKAYLTVNITVTLQDGSNVTAIIQSSDVPDTDPLDGIAYIMPLEFIWHCLGEDTQVMLADGSLKAIADFKAGDKVRTDNDNGHGTVSATHVAAHPGEVLKIEVSGGHTLVASTRHIIMTPKGGVQTHQLKKGDEVITLAGAAKVTAVTTLPADNRNLWNLSLGQAPHFNDPAPETGCFFANGILVGDARAERAMHFKYAKDINWVKANVPTSFHTDVESTFAQRKSMQSGRIVG